MQCAEFFAIPAGCIQGYICFEKVKLYCYYSVEYNRVIEKTLLLKLYRFQLTTRHAVSNQAIT